MQPFVARGGDAATALAEGLAEDLATGLARFSYLTVVQSAGTRFRVEGSVRASGASLRVAARLVDVAGGADVWAHQFDGDASRGLIDVQDEIVSQIVTALADENGGIIVRAVSAD